MELREIQVHKVCKVQREHRDLKGIREILVLLGHKGRKATRVIQVHKVCKVQREHRDLKVQRVP